MRVFKAALIIMLGNVASRLLGLVREQVIAILFGASAATDAFTAAGRVPTIVYDLLIGGAISAALVPVFSDYQDQDPELSGMLSSILSLALVCLAVVSVLLAILAGPIMGVFGYGFSAGTQGEAVLLARLMSPAVVFMGLSGVLTAFLYSRQSFTWPALAISGYNGGIIVVALLFHKQLGLNSLVMGLLLGTVLQVAVQLPRLRGFRYSLRIGLSHPGVRRIGVLYLPVALGLVVSAIGVAIDTNLASRTGEGSLAALRFATTLIQLPLGLVASAMSFAILPTLARHAAQAFPGASTVEGQPTSTEGIHLYRNDLATGMKAMLLLILPATVGLVLLRTPLVQVLFQYGRFNASDTERTALAFLAYSPGLPAAAIDQLLIFAFYARKNTVVPVVVGVISILVYLVVALSLIGPMGMAGLALANSAQWVSHAAIMFVLLWRSLGGFAWHTLGSPFLKVIAASAVMGAFLFGYESFLAGNALPPGTSQAGYLAAAIALGAIVYGAAVLVLRVEEAHFLWRQLEVKLGR